MGDLLQAGLGISDMGTPWTDAPPSAETTWTVADVGVQEVKSGPTGNQPIPPPIINNT